MIAKPENVPKIRFRDAQIELAHGAGGKASRRLIEGLFAPLPADRSANLRSTGR